MTGYLRNNSNLKGSQQLLNVKRHLWYNIIYYLLHKLYMIQTFTI